MRVAFRGTGDAGGVSLYEGWLYLAGITDLFTCEIVGYETGAHRIQELVGQNLFQVVQNRRPAIVLIHHSDRSNEYCAHDNRQILEQFGVRAPPCHGDATVTTIHRQ
jgi:transposase InsO family protein